MNEKELSQIIVNYGKKNIINEIQGRGVSLATTVFYNPDSEMDRVRIPLAEKTLQTVIEKGYSLVVVYGKCPDEFLKKIENLGAILLKEDAKTMGGGRRQAIKACSDLGTEYAGWLEPEKLTYAPEIWKTIVPLLSGKADLVMPRRADNLDSYPKFQQLTEQAGNNILNMLTGAELDWYVGPRTWKNKLTSYFLIYDGKFKREDKTEVDTGDKWESIFNPILRMIYDGKIIQSVDVNFTYPSEQRAVEEKLFADIFPKRVEQLGTLTANCIKYWKELQSFNK